MSRIEIGFIVVGHIGSGRIVFAEIVAHQFDDLGVAIPAEDTSKKEIPFAVKNIPVEMLEIPVVFIEREEKVYGAQTKRQKNYINNKKKFNKKIYNRKVIR